MWKALDIVCKTVKEGGILFIMIYLDRGIVSLVWCSIKKFYCSGAAGKIMVTSIFVPYFIIRGLVEDILSLRNPIKRYREYKNKRGMSCFHDWIDWLGGYPYEFARPEQIIMFVQERGFVVQKINGAEYVFKKQYSKA